MVDDASVLLSAVFVDSSVGLALGSSGGVSACSVGCSISTAVLIFECVL